MHVSTRSLLRAAAGAAAAVAIVPTVAVPAYAEHLTVDDARGDMWRVLEGGSEPTQTPKATVGDFVSTTYRYTQHRVIVRAKFVDLQRTGKRFTVWVTMRDQDHHKTYLGVRATRGDRAGTAFLMTNRGGDVDCNIWMRLDYARNTMRAGFPRECVNDPRYLQFQTLSEHVRSTWKYAWLDNALSNEIDVRRWTEKVHRGAA